MQIEPPSDWVWNKAPILNLQSKLASLFRRIWERALPKLRREFQETQK